MFIILKSFGAGMGRLIILIWLGLSDNLLDLISLTWRCKCRWKCNLWTCFDFLLLVFSILSSETSESVSFSSNWTKSKVSKNNFVFSSLFWQEEVKDDEKLIVNWWINCNSSDWKSTDLMMNQTALPTIWFCHFKLTKCPQHC